MKAIVQSDIIISCQTFHLDALSIFDGGKMLLDSVLQVNIIGVSGLIKFNKDENLVHPAYEVINIKQNNKIL